MAMWRGLRCLIDTFEKNKTSHHTPVAIKFATESWVKLSSPTESWDLKIDGLEIPEPCYTWCPLLDGPMILRVTYTWQNLGPLLKVKLFVNYI